MCKRQYACHERLAARSPHLRGQRRGPLALLGLIGSRAHFTVSQAPNRPLVDLEPSRYCLLSVGATGSFEDSAGVVRRPSVARGPLRRKGGAASRRHSLAAARLGDILVVSIVPASPLRCLRFQVSTARFWACEAHVSGPGRINSPNAHHSRPEPRHASRHATHVAAGLHAPGMADDDRPGDDGATGTRLPSSKRLQKSFFELIAR